LLSNIEYTDLINNGPGLEPKSCVSVTSAQ
jgi:hypothetical protein